MPKARVYELAKELGVDSKTVLNKLVVNAKLLGDGRICEVRIVYR